MKEYKEEIIRPAIATPKMSHDEVGANLKNKKKIIKDNLFKVPEIFEIIQRDTNSTTKEMYEVFNMGHRMEIYCDNSIADNIISISKEFEVDAKIIGRVEESSKNSLFLKSGEEIIEY